MLANETTIIFSDQQHTHPNIEAPIAFFCKLFRNDLNGRSIIIIMNLLHVDSTFQATFVRFVPICCILLSSFFFFLILFVSAAVLSPTLGNFVFFLSIPNYLELNRKGKKSMV